MNLHKKGRRNYYMWGIDPTMKTFLYWDCLLNLEINVINIFIYNIKNFNIILVYKRTLKMS